MLQRTWPSLYLSRLNSNSGHLQTRINDCESGKTKLTSHHGLNIFNHMPVWSNEGSEQAPACNGMILCTIKWQLSFVCIEDILKFSRSVFDHLFLLCSVLDLLCDAGVLLKLKKCFFSDDETDYHAQVKKPEKLTVLNEATDGLCTLKQLAQVIELMSFTTFCNVFCPLDSTPAVRQPYWLGS